MPIVTGLIVISVGILKAAKAKITTKGVLAVINITASLVTIVTFSRSWGNSDADAFREKMDQLIRDCRELQTCMEEYCNLMDRSIAEYERTQQEVKNEANKLDSPKNR